MSYLDRSNMGVGQFLGCSIGLVFACIGCLILVFVWANIEAANRNTHGRGERYASKTEIETILNSCGVGKLNRILSPNRRDYMDLPAGVEVSRVDQFLPLGFAWNAYQSDPRFRDQLKCFEQGLSKLGATAVVWDMLG